MNNLMHRRESWDPFDLISDLQSDLNRVFNRSLTRKDDWDRSFSPSIEVHEEADHYFMKADLPGLKKEDLNISVQGNQLTLKGERKQDQEKKEKGVYFSERWYGSFSRTMEFPVELDAARVKASYKDGVLEITLPKSESAKPKQISVEIK